MPSKNKALSEKSDKISIRNNILSNILSLRVHEAID